MVHGFTALQIALSHRLQDLIQFREGVESNLIVAVDLKMDDQGSCLPAVVVHRPLLAAP
jgi:hypothetical protein